MSFVKPRKAVHGRPARADRLPLLKQQMDAASIRISVGYGSQVRLVTHLDIDDDGIQRTIDALRLFAST